MSRIINELIPLFSLFFFCMNFRPQIAFRLNDGEQNKNLRQPPYCQNKLSKTSPTACNPPHGWKQPHKKNSHRHHGKSHNESVAHTGRTNMKKNPKQHWYPSVQLWRFPVRSTSRYASKPAITMVFGMKSWYPQRRESAWRKFLFVEGLKLGKINFFTGV